MPQGSGEKLSHENKGELLKCLESLLGSEDESSDSADWVEVVDMGGLLHVREGTYMLQWGKKCASIFEWEKWRKLQMALGSLLKQQ